MDDGIEEGREEGRIHLVVAVHLDDDVGTVSQGGTEPGDHCAAHSHVGPVAHHFETRILDGRQRIEGLVERRVVDDDDVIDEFRNPLDDLADVARDVVRGNHHGDPTLLIHLRLLPLSFRPDGRREARCRRCARSSR